MIHIHPFPARMAPEIALKSLEELPSSYTVLDPMSGSGMVLGMASKLGLSSIGFDLDPLACLISKVNATPIDESRALAACERLVSAAKRLDVSNISLPWVDNETLDYMNFWFAEKQFNQLKALSFLLICDPIEKNAALNNALKVALSRLIVTKEPKASLARDTAHSRPHRTISENSFDIFNAIPASLAHILRALKPDKIQAETKNYRGDARHLRRLKDASVDHILTSPPYLNAIDYMRGHRLSLVWLGYKVSDLRKIRSRSVGAEKIGRNRANPELDALLDHLPENFNARKRKMLARYYADLSSITKEAFRVLGSGRTATYVVGDSTISGHPIRNSDFLVSAAVAAGFAIQKRTEREIPENRRYMPLINSKSSDLSKRMRTEHIITLSKR